MQITTISWTCVSRFWEIVPKQCTTALNFNIRMAILNFGKPSRRATMHDLVQEIIGLHNNFFTAPLAKVQDVLSLPAQVYIWACKVILWLIEQLAALFKDHTSSTSQLLYHVSHAMTFRGSHPFFPFFPMCNAIFKALTSCHLSTFQHCLHNIREAAKPS